MKRIAVQMDDPIFLPGVAKTATAPITISPSGLACQAELYLGISPATKVVTSGLVSFTSTGAQQTVSLPVTMPAVSGVAYHVYLDVYVEGMLLLAYFATEDVVIPAGSVGPIVWT